jgi:hypothetical protein
VTDNLKKKLAREIRQSRHGVVCKRVAMAMCKVMSPAVPRYDTCLPHPTHGLLVNP